MTSQVIKADERLATVFSHFYCVQQPPDAEPLEQQLLPNYEMLLGFNFGPPVSARLGDAAYVIEQTAVLGPLQKTLVYQLPPGADLIIVNFTLDGFYRLMGTPMHQFKTVEAHHPDDLLGKTCFTDLWSQLARMPKQEDRLYFLTEYALAFVAPSNTAVLPLFDSIPYFQDSSVDPVKALAETHSVSIRSLQLRFQNYLGYSAKELIRYLRFKKVLHFLYQDYAAAIDWLELVARFGYHDQSHLIKDFRHFVGLTPRQFLKQLAQGGACISGTAGSQREESGDRR